MSEITYRSAEARAAHAARMRNSLGSLDAAPQPFGSWIKAAKATKSRADYGLTVLALLTALALGCVGTAAWFAWSLPH